MIKNITEFLVGCFILAGMIALLLLALRVSGISKYSTYNTYQITAKFTNIGDLKVRAPVKIAGVILPVETIFSIHAILLATLALQFGAQMLTLKELQ